MILDTTTKSLQVKLSGAVTTTQLPCVTTWADITTSAFTPGSTDTQTNSTTAVTIVAAPAASTQRQIKEVNVYNADTANATVTIFLNNNSTLRTLLSVTLPSGQTLQFGENSWSVIDNNGNIQQASQVSAAGSDKQIQFNDGGTALGGDSNLTWDKTSQTMTLSGGANINLTADTAVSPTPPTGYVSIFGRTVANRDFPAMIDSTGLSTSLQPLLARNKVGYWDPPGNANTVPGVFGITAPTTVGTLTARNVATTDLATRMRRLGFVSSATAGNFAEARIAVTQFSCGSGVNNDGSGFFFVIRWVPSSATVVSGERNFVGMISSTAAATNVEPSTLTNAIGIAQLSTDNTQLYLIHSGSSAQTATALGTNFPGSQISTTAYEFALFAPNSVANTYYYQVTNLTSGNLTTGTLTGTAVQIPQSSTLLAIKQYATNNTTAAAVAFDICSIYIETDD